MLGTLGGVYIIVCNHTQFCIFLGPPTRIFGHPPPVQPEGHPGYSPYRIFHTKPVHTLSRPIVDQQLTYGVVYLNGITLIIHRISDLSSKKWKNYKLNHFFLDSFYIRCIMVGTCSASTLTPPQEYNTHKGGYGLYYKFIVWGVAR